MIYQDLIEQIEDAVENREQSFVDNIDSFVRRAEQRIYRSARLPGARNRNTSTPTVAGVATYSWPSGFLLPLSMSVTVSGTYNVLLLKDVSYIWTAYPTTATQGVPRVYGNMNDTQFVIAPTPNAAYTINIDYYGFPNSIVDDGTSWLGDNAEEVLFYASIVEAYIYLKGDADVMAMYEKKFTEALALLAQDAMAQSEDENLGSTVI